MKKKIIFISVLTIIVIMALLSLLFSTLFFVERYNSTNNNLNMNNQPQSIVEPTQLLDENVSEEMKNKELNKKMKSILYGVLSCTGEIEKKYNEEEVNKSVNKMNLVNGIYLSEKSREKVLGLIKNITNLNYQVDMNGYLISKGNVENEYAQQLEKIITGNKSVIIDYNIYYYCLLGDDICTFNIERNQYLQKFTSDDLTILILNPVKYEEEYESERDLVMQIVNNAMEEQ